MARLLTRVNVSIMDRSVLNGEGSVLGVRLGTLGIKTERDPLVVCEREHLVSRTLSTYVTSVSFRAATSVAINHAARATADTVRRLACLMTDQSARARVLTFAYVRQGACRDVREKKGRSETLFSHSCAGCSAAYFTPYPTDRNRWR